VCINECRLNVMYDVPHNSSFQVHLIGAAECLNE
jgi:hypothetical protein